MKLKYIYQIMRPHWSISSTLAALLGISLAWKDGYHNSLLSMIIILSTFISHVFMEIWDEITDYKSYRMLLYDNDEHQTNNLSGGSAILTNHLLSLPQAINIFNVLLMVYLILISYIIVITGWHIFYYGLSGLILLFGYSSFLKLSYRGMGELANFLTFGPIIVCGSYTAIKLSHFQTYLLNFKDLYQSILQNNWKIIINDASFFFGLVTNEVLLLSLILGLIWFAGIHISEMYDIEEDIFANKRTLVVRFGKKFGAYMQLLSLCVIPFIIILLAIFNNVLYFAGMIPVFFLLRQSCLFYKNGSVN